MRQLPDSIYSIIRHSLLHFFMSYFPPMSAPVAPIPAVRPTRPIHPGRISSWDSLDDRIRPATPDIPIDTFERLENGQYRRVGSMSMPVIPEATFAPVPTHRIGWRTVLQVIGVMIAGTTLSIASYNLYSRTHP